MVAFKYKRYFKMGLCKESNSVHNYIQYIQLDFIAQHKSNTAVHRSKQRKTRVTINSKKGGSLITFRNLWSIGEHWNVHDSYPPFLAQILKTIQTWSCCNRGHSFSLCFTNKKLGQQEVPHLQLTTFFKYHDIYHSST